MAAKKKKTTGGRPKKPRAARPGSRAKKPAAASPGLPPEAEDTSKRRSTHPSAPKRRPPEAPRGATGVGGRQRDDSERTKPARARRAAIAPASETAPVRRQRGAEAARGATTPARVQVRRIRATASGAATTGAGPSGTAEEALPESYGSNRVRLLAKDPHSLFAFWDVDARSRAELERDLGRRAAALSRLTLRVGGEGPEPAQVVLLPDRARSHHLRAEPRRASYRAELGYTLPSGEFRLLAESNVVSLPPVGASPVGAARRVRVNGLPAESSLPLDTGAGPRPLEPGAVDQKAAGRPSSPGGASDVHRR